MSEGCLPLSSQGSRVGSQHLHGDDEGDPGPTLSRPHRDGVKSTHVSQKPEVRWQPRSLLLLLLQEWLKGLSGPGRVLSAASRIPTPVRLFLLNKQLAIVTAI